MTLDIELPLGVESLDFDSQFGLEADGKVGDFNSDSFFKHGNSQFSLLLNGLGGLSNGE